MLVRIKPCVDFRSYDTLFGDWARSYLGSSFDVTQYDFHGDIRYIPSDLNTMLDPSDYRYFLKKELIFIKEKK